MELITVSKTALNGAEINSVNMRDIYSELEVSKDYSSWAKQQIERLGLVENKNYLKVTQRGESKIEYIVDIDTAKNICLISFTPKGQEIRDYFIECEKNLSAKQFQIPQTYSEALLLASKQAEQIEQQKELIAIQAPKVDFYEAVTGSSDTIDIGTVAKVLNIDGYGRTRLFAFLRDKGVLRANNEPYQTYCDRGYFRVIESKFSKPDGSTHVSLKTVVYQKGVDYIRKLVVGAQ